MVAMLGWFLNNLGMFVLLQNEKIKASSFFLQKLTLLRNFSFNFAEV